jgi:hypothetical protein
MVERLRHRSCCALAQLARAMWPTQFAVKIELRIPVLYVPSSVVVVDFGDLASPDTLIVALHSPGDVDEPAHLHGFGSFC